MEHNPGIQQKIGSWLVINEPGTANVASSDWHKLVADNFPWIRFVQKTENSRGQAKSLNLILDEIKPFQYWLQWEEAWFCTQPFLDTALCVMETNPRINQLQLTCTTPENKADWFHQRVKGHEEGWSIIPSHPEVFESLKIEHIDMSANRIWPVYSLRPSLNTVHFYETLPKFSTSPGMWPLKFEWDFGRNWVLAGGVKAILLGGPVTRSVDHKSTYS